MYNAILEKIAKNIARKNNDEEYQLARKTKKALFAIKSRQKKAKNIHENRGGLNSMGARGVFVKEGGIYNRRVIVKSKFRTNKDSSFKDSVRNHLEYMTRKGAGENGERPTLFSSVSDEIDSRKIIEKFSTSPHNFRMIISPDNGDSIDLKKFTRDLVTTIEKDINTKIDWVASIHHDTNEPHVHLVISGNDVEGERLLLKRDYISNAIRHRASEIITNKLGLREREEVLLSLRFDVNKDNKCALDNMLTKRIENDKINLKELYRAHSQDIPKDLFQRRLAHLESKNLANKIDEENWRISKDYISKLKELNRTNSIIESLSNTFNVDKQKCGVLTANMLDDPIEGRVIKRGLVDELDDNEYIFIETKHDKHYFIELEKYSEKIKATKGELVKITGTKALSGPKKSDINIDKLAKENNGIYDAQEHAKTDKKLPPGVTPAEYAQVHVNHLEVMARRGLVEKIGDGRYRIPKDYLDKLTLEAKKSQNNFKAHIKVTRMAPREVQRQALSKGHKP